MITRNKIHFLKFNHQYLVIKHKPSRFDKIPTKLDGTYKRMVFNGVKVYLHKICHKSEPLVVWCIKKN